MSLLDWFIDDPEMDPTEKLLMHGLERYGEFQTMQNVAGAVLPDEDRDLGRQEKRLDIAMKKRALGMNDSETYDESRNDNWPLYAVTARHALQKIPEAGFLKSDLSPFFKIARSATPHDASSIARRLLRALS